MQAASDKRDSANQPGSQPEAAAVPSQSRPSNSTLVPESNNPLNADALLRLPLAELLRRGGAKPGAEMVDHEYSGDWVIDEKGRDLSVIVWRKLGEEEIQGISISWMRDGKARHVWQYEPGVDLDSGTSSFICAELGKAYNRLVTDGNFKDFRRQLKGLQRLSEMKEVEFNPSPERFNLSEAALRNPEFGVRELKGWLHKHGVSSGRIERNPGKKLSDLYNELKNGESELSSEGGTVHLSSTVVLMEIVNRDHEGVLSRVVEKFQQFDNGYIQIRQTFGGVPGEKAARGESIHQAVERGLKEELQVTRMKSISLGEAHDYIEESCYPGIFGRQHYVPVRVELHAEDVRPEYRERTEPKDGKSGKTTVMGWQPILEAEQA